MPEDNLLQISEDASKSKIIPPWQLIKGQYLKLYYDAGTALATYRWWHSSNPDDWYRFKNNLITLYINLRPKLATLDSEKYAKLKKLDFQVMQMENYWMTTPEVIECYFLLGEAMEELGITKIEVPADEESPDNKERKAFGTR